MNANAHKANCAIRLAPAAEPARTFRMNKPGGNADTRLDQVPEHLLASVKGPQQRDRRGRYFATG
jgi:hypothetical protein